jgi:predicted nucleic acid-binding Zn ribbon protein
MSVKKGKAEFQTVGDAIRGLLSSYRIETKFDEAALLASWERLVGGPIAKRTKKIFIRDRTLYVEFKSPSMKHDFLLHKSKVLEVFQKEFGTSIVKDIVIL